MADSINILVPKEAIDSIIQTDAAITKLDIVYRKMLTTIEQGSKILKDNATSEEGLAKAKKTQTETTEQLDAASKKLAASEAALNSFDKEKFAQTARNNQALKDQQGEILKMVQAEKQLTGTIEKAEASTKALTAERKKLDLETIEGQKRLKEINITIDKNTEIMRVNGDAATKQRMNIGNYQSALQGLPGPLGQAASGVSRLGAALKALLLNPVALAIAAIGAALYGLFKAFTSTESGGDKFRRTISSLKEVMEVLKSVAQDVAMAINDIFSKSIEISGKKAENSSFKISKLGFTIIQTFAGIGKNTKDAAKSGGDLYDALDQIGSEKLAYNIDAVREKIAQLRTQAAETADEKIKAKFLQQSIDMTEEMYSKEIDWSKRTTDATLANLSNRYKISSEDIKAYTLLNYEERVKINKSNLTMNHFAEKLNDEGLAKLKTQITEESRLRTDSDMETLRMRKSITSSIDISDKEAAAAYKKRVDDRVKLLENDVNVVKAAADAQAKAIEDAEKATAAIRDTLRNEELSKLDQEYLTGKIGIEEYEKQKYDITQKWSEKALQEQIDNTKAAIARGSNLTKEQQDQLLADAAKFEAEKKNTTDQVEKATLQGQIDNINKIITESALSEGQKTDLLKKSSELQLQIDDEAVKKKTDNIKKVEEAQKTALTNMDIAQQEEINALTEQLFAGEISYDKYESSKTDINHKYAQKRIQADLDNINKRLSTEILSESQIADLKKKAVDDQKSLDDIEFDNWKKAQDKKKEIINAVADLMKEAASSIGEVINTNIEKEISGIEKKRDAELTASDESIKDEKKKKEAQAAINAKYDKLVAEEKTKQAKNDKAAALFQIAINTAVAITKAAPDPILIALAAALGIIQAGAVLAKPLPTFAKGTRGQFNTPSAFVAGEAGTEVIQKQTGEIMAVTRPTIFTNAKGMRIYSNPEIQNLQKMMVNNQINFDTSELKEIHKGIDNMAKSLAGQRQYIMQNGKATGYTQGDYTRKYLERMIG